MAVKCICNIVCSLIKVVAWITSLIVYIKDGALPIIMFRGVDERPYANREKRLPTRVVLKLLLRYRRLQRIRFPEASSTGILGAKWGNSAMWVESGGDAIGNTQRGNHADSIRPFTHEGKRRKYAITCLADYYIRLLKNLLCWRKSCTRIENI